MARYLWGGKMRGLVPHGDAGRDKVEVRRLISNGPLLVECGEFIWERPTPYEPFALFKTQVLDGGII